MEMDQRIMVFSVIAVGGAAGALLRYLFSGFVQKSVDSVFPVGTFAVNLLGAFLIGVFWSMSEEFIVSTYFKLFLFVGLLGSLTTFSTYTLETMNLYLDGETSLALSNILLSNVACMMVLVLGIITSRVVINFFR